MGLLVNGVWQDQWYDTKSTGGHFQRTVTSFRSWITPDGKAGPSGNAGFAAERGRFHLYVSLACPWAHRTLIARKLKGLEDFISVSVVHPLMLDQGWTFDDYPAATGDELFGKKRLYEVYLEAKSDYSGRVTVPVLWDRKTNMIVNNESAEIIRMFNTAFNELTGNRQDYYPEALRTEIDEINAPIYKNINNGVYRVGFATTQEAYEEAFEALFAGLDEVEKRLSQRRYLAGDKLTEADIRLFTTLVRFDPVYVGHFKCNLRRMEDYPNLSNYLRELFQIPAFGETTNFDHIKTHYYASHRQINPTGIVPLGPELHLDAPHDRGRFTKAA